MKIIFIICFDTVMEQVIQLCSCTADGVEPFYFISGQSGSLGLSHNVQFHAVDRFEADRSPKFRFSKITPIEANPPSASHIADLCSLLPPFSFTMNDS